MSRANGQKALLPGLKEYSETQVHLRRLLAIFTPKSRI